MSVTVNTKNLLSLFKANLRENLTLSLFFFAGIVLMYFGYFFTACSYCDYVYGAFLITWIVLYAVIFGLILKPIYSLYSWFLFLLFFPKKAVNMEHVSTVFGTLFHINHEMLRFSIYEVLEVGLISALVLGLFKHADKQKITMIDYGLMLVIVSGIIHSLVNYGEIDNVLMFQGLMPLITAWVLYKSVALVESRQQLEKIFSFFLVFGFILFVEYTLGRLDILPDSIQYYIFNYRNAFRSIFVSSDLLIALILIVAALIAIYRYKRENRPWYLILFLIYSYLILETFNRTPLFALVIVTLLLAVYFKQWVKALLFIGLIYFVMIPISKNISSSPLPDYMVYALKHGITADEAYDLLHPGLDEYVETYFPSNEQLDIKMKNIEIGTMNYNYERANGDGYFSTGSVLDRLGASFRGIDVLIHSNFLGSGPGAAVVLMTDQSIPSYINKSFFFGNETVEKFYNQVRTSEHPTNTHMLYTHLLAEYGVFILLFFVGVIASFVKLLKQNLQHDKDVFVMISLAIVLAFSMYYTFQVVPVIISVVLFFFSVAESQQHNADKNLVSSSNKG
jgi:hypothetical protein